MIFDRDERLRTGEADAGAFLRELRCYCRDVRVVRLFRVAEQVHELVRIVHEVVILAERQETCVVIPLDVLVGGRDDAGPRSRRQRIR